MFDKKLEWKQKEELPSSIILTWMKKKQKWQFQRMKWELALAFSWETVEFCLNVLPISKNEMGVGFGIQLGDGGNGHITTGMTTT